MPYQIKKWWIAREDLTHSKEPLLLYGDSVRECRDLMDDVDKKYVITPITWRGLTHLLGVITPIHVEPGNQANGPLMFRRYSGQITVIT